VDVAMLDCQLALLENAVARWLNAGDLPGRLGSRHPLIAPFQAFPTADEPIAVCVDTDAQWARLCSALEREPLATDPRFRDGGARVRRHAELEPLLVEAFRARGRKEWLAILAAADIPCGPVNTVADAVQDPQILARGEIVEAPPGGARFAGVPIHTTSHRPGGERPAPRLGEHTDEILGELGLPGEEIGRLRAAGVV
jgi:CoA:oxalate CoA-transferase